MRWSNQKTYDDAVLGQLTRIRACWRGTIDLGADGSIPLAIPGPRSAPDQGTLRLARSIPKEYVRCDEDLKDAFADHRAPYVEPDAPPLEGLPTPAYAAVITIDGQPTIEIGYNVGWDEEHTLGARIRNGRLIELNGSVLEP